MTLVLFDQHFRHPSSGYRGRRPLNLAEGFIMARTQIYGGREADEYRNNRDLVNDIMADNDIVEGEQVAHLRKLLQTMYSNPTPTTKAAVPAYLEQLKKEGYSESRVISIYTRASARVAIPDSRKIKR